MIVSDVQYLLVSSDRHMSSESMNRCPFRLKGRICARCGFVKSDVKFSMSRLIQDKLIPIKSKDSVVIAQFNSNHRLACSSAVFRPFMTENDDSIYSC